MARWGDVDAGDDHNFWRMAETGPCGPCSEIHFDRGAHLSEGPHCLPDHSEHCPRWLEIWNLVFMEFDQRPEGPRVPLPFKSVDTGMGLERLSSILQDVPTNYDTDLFTPIHARMRDLLGHDPDAFESERFSYQVIADHSRAITFPRRWRPPSNEDVGTPAPDHPAGGSHGRLGREPNLAGSRGGVETMAGAYPPGQAWAASWGARAEEASCSTSTLGWPTRGGPDPLTGADRPRPGRGTQATHLFPARRLLHDTYAS
jgi:hypothetical protein